MSEIALGRDPDLELTALLDTEAAVETFWEQVKTNLQAGRIRLVFVADHIPSELQRIVEFLNGQMDPAEVVAVEIRQYIGQGLKTLVPRVLGHTAETRPKKTPGSRTGRQWDDATFFQELATQHGQAEVEVARQILAWARPRMTRIWWGKGGRNGSFVAIINHNGKDHQLFAVWTYGTVEIYFYWYQFKPPFDVEQKRYELLRRLNAIPGIALSPDVITKRPGIPLSTLKDPAALTQFLEVYEWVLQEITAV